MTDGAYSTSLNTLLEIKSGQVHPFVSKNRKTNPFSIEFPSSSGISFLHSSHKQNLIIKLQRLPDTYPSFSLLHTDTLTPRHRTHLRRHQPFGLMDTDHILAAIDEIVVVFRDVGHISYNAPLSRTDIRTFRYGRVHTLDTFLRLYIGVFPILKR